MNEKEMLRKKKYLEEVRLSRESKQKFLAPKISSLGVTAPLSRVGTLPVSTEIHDSLISSSAKNSDCTITTEIKSDYPVEVLPANLNDRIESFSEEIAGPLTSSPISSFDMISAAFIKSSAMREKKEMVVVVPRNGFDLLRAWDPSDSMEKNSEADSLFEECKCGNDDSHFIPSPSGNGLADNEQSSGHYIPISSSTSCSCYFSPSSHPVAQLNSAIFSEVFSSAGIQSTIPPIIDLSVGTMPWNLSDDLTTFSKLDCQGTQVKVQGSRQREIEEKIGQALLERSLQEESEAVVMAAAYSTASRFGEEDEEVVNRKSTRTMKEEEAKFSFSKGIGMLGGDGRFNDRATSHSGTPWGASQYGSAEWGATTASGQHGFKFGSELDHFLILNSPGLALVWILLPTVHAEIRKRRQQNSHKKRSTTGGPQGQNSSADTIDIPESHYLSSVSDITVVVPLVCDADIRTITLHPSQPGVLLGGTRSGRVVWWNFAASWSSWTLPQLISRCIESSGAPHTLLLPCQRPSCSSFPSLGGGILHLTVLQVSGVQQVCAVREDGYICTWSASPSFTLKTVLKPDCEEKPLSFHATCASTVVTQNSSIVKVLLGTSSGTIYIGHFGGSESERIHYRRFCSASEREASSSLLTTVSSRVLDGTSHVGFVNSIACQSSTKVPYFHFSPFDDHNPNPVKEYNPMESLISSGGVNADTRSENVAFITCGIHGESFLWQSDKVTSPLSLSFSATTAISWFPGSSTLFASGTRSGAIFLYSLADMSRYVIMVPFNSFENPLLSSALLQILPNQGFSSSFSSLKIAGLTAGSKTTIPESISENDNSLSLVSALEFSPDGKWLFAGNDAGSIVIFRVLHEW